MGIYYEYITGYLYSIGEDKFFRVYDVSQKNILAELQVGGQMLTKLEVDRASKRAFIANKGGNVFIYDISPV